LIGRLGYDLYIIEAKFESILSLIRDKGLMGRTITIRQKPVTQEFLVREIKEISRKQHKTQVVRELATEGWYSIFFLGKTAFLFVLLCSLFALLRIARLKGINSFVVGISLLIVYVLLMSLERPVSISNPDTEHLSSHEMKEIISHIRTKGRVKWNDETRGRMIRKLREISHKGTITERIYSCELMGLDGDRSTYNTLVAALRDSERYVRYKAVEALGRLGVPDAKNEIEMVARNDSWYVSSYALGALRRLDPSRY
jgi:biopolymer transport protein ExbD